LELFSPVVAVALALELRDSGGWWTWNIDAVYAVILGI